MQVRNFENQKGKLTRTQRRLNIYFLLVWLSAQFSFRDIRPATDKLVYSQAGDVKSNSVILWGRYNQKQNTQLKFKLATNKHSITNPNNQGHSRKSAQKVSDATDYTGSTVFKGLKPNTHYYYQATCKPLGKNTGDTVAGKLSRFTTAADKHQAEAVRFVWVADLGGQGWGRKSR